MIAGAVVKECHPDARREPSEQHHQYGPRVISASSVNQQAGYMSWWLKEEEYLVCSSQAAS